MIFHKMGDIKILIFFLVIFLSLLLFFVNFPRSKNVRSSSMRVDVSAFNDFLVDAKRDADLWRKHHGNEVPRLGFLSNDIKGFHGSERVLVSVVSNGDQWYFSVKVNGLDLYSCELVSDFMFVSNRIRYGEDKKNNWSLVSYGENSLLFDRVPISELSFSEAYHSFLFKRSDLCNAKSGFADFFIYESVPPV